MLDDHAGLVNAAGMTFEGHLSRSRPLPVL
jgi:hypothetical protein